MDFFTADTHFGHDNIRRFCNRPFSSVEEMDEAIIANINAKVGERDRLFVLGDFTFRGDEPKAYLKRINCQRVILIKGNHDPNVQGNFDLKKSHDAKGFAGFHEVYDYYEYRAKLDGEKKFIVLFHYPIIEWNRWHHGSWHLFGHVHRGRQADFKDQYAIDVGVDCHDFHPLSLEDVAKIMEAKEWEDPHKIWKEQGRVWAGKAPEDRSLTENYGGTDG